MIANIDTHLEHSDPHIADKLEQIIKAIHQSTHGRDGWVSIRAIAREVDGAETMADVVAGYMSLPQAREYIVLKRNLQHARLTEAGHQRAQALRSSFTAQESTPTSICARDTHETSKEDTVNQVATAVKSYAKRLEPLHYQVDRIIKYGSIEGKHIYGVVVTLGDTLVPTDSFASLKTVNPTRRYDGRIVYQDTEANILFISLTESVVDDPEKILLSVDRAYLLYQLAESLMTLRSLPEQGKAIFPGYRSQSIALAHHDSAVVGEQLAALKPPWTRFLWGPPGAGKTYGLARFVVSLLERKRDERILITAPSNIAADVALLHLVTQLANSECADVIDNRQILRYGYPRKTEVLTRSELLGSEAMETNSKKIDRYARKLKRAKNTMASPDEIAKLRAGLLALQEKQKDLVRAHAKQCSVVVTTTAQCYLPNSPIPSIYWTTTIIDEVTMVPPAVCLLVSSLAQKRFLLAGDPRQLGPVYESRRGEDGERNNVYQWLGQDIFAFSELPIDDENAPMAAADARLARITSQRRCSADIWQPISHLYPRVNSLVDESSLEPIARLEPQSGTAVTVIDLAQSAQEAHCNRIKKSWENQVSAETAVAIADKMLQESNLPITIAIITPYRGQHQLLKKLLSDQNLDDRVDCGTVHQFQGSEADVVIFDPVDGPRRRKVGHMLTGKTGTRLVNVAVSRAKAKLIVLAHLPWYAEHLNQDDNTILHTLLREVPSDPVVKSASVRNNKHHNYAKKFQPNSEQAQESVATSPVSTTISKEDICEKWLTKMLTNVAYTIASRSDKKALNKQLYALGYQSVYKETTSETIWRHASERIVVVKHEMNTVTRLA